MERNQRTEFQGVVTSIKNDKTICVTVSTERNDPLYNKRVGYSKKYYAHDEKNAAKVGDIVTIMSCRPISKTKRYLLVSIDKKAEVIIKAEAAEASLEAEEGSAEEIKPAEKPVEEKPVEKKAAKEEKEVK